MAIFTPVRTRQNIWILWQGIGPRTPSFQLILYDAAVGGILGIRLSQQVRLSVHSLNRTNLTTGIRLELSQEIHYATSPEWLLL